MIVERRTGQGREVLCGLIVSTPLLAAAAGKWTDDGLFPDKWSNLIARWCVDYYRKYRKAPGRQIESIFENWCSRRQRDEETIKLIDSFLVGLDRDYARLRKSINPDYLIDVAGRFFNIVRYREFKDQLEGLVRDGDLEAAEKLRIDFRRVEFGAGSAVNVLEGGEPVRDAFENRGEVLVKWGVKALDTFFDTALESEAFVVYAGRQKSGKSFWMQETVFRAVTQDRNTAFFEVGDQSQRQVLRRIGARAAGRPVKAERNVMVPTSIAPGPPPQTEYATKSWAEPITWEEADRALRKLGKRHGPGRLKLFVHPNKSITAAQVETKLDDLVREDWHPSVVVVDYLPLLAPMNSKDILRDQLNASAEVLRRISQRFRCLVVTGAQVKREAHNARIIRMSDLSDDIRLASHVTALVGINRTEKEKEQGLCRLNMAAGRDLAFGEEKELWVAGCLPLANPAMFACF